MAAARNERCPGRCGWKGGTYAEMLEHVKECATVNDLLVLVHVDGFQTHKDYTGGSSYGGCKIGGLAQRIEETMRKYPSAVIHITPSKSTLAALRKADAMERSKHVLAELEAERDKVQALIDDAIDEDAGEFVGEPSE